MLKSLTKNQCIVLHVHCVIMLTSQYWCYNCRQKAAKIDGKIKNREESLK